MKLYFCHMEFDKQLAHLIEEALKEDIGDGDHSTLSSIEPGSARGKAVLKIKPGWYTGGHAGGKSHIYL